MQLEGGADAVHIRHTDIHQEDVDRLGGADGQRLATAADAANQVQVGFLLQ
jgi:hypothetical protein